MRDARRFAGIALALGACLARPAAAQTPDQPNLIFTISGGLITGGRELWSLPRQLAIVSPFGSSYAWDTVGLGRKMASGFLATLTATYYWTPHLGVSGEAGIFGLESVSSCAVVGQFHATADNQNAQACSFVNGQTNRGDAFGLLAGLTYRVTTRGIQPYVRAAAGGAFLGSSFIEEASDVLVSGGSVSTVYFLADEHHKELTWMVSLGAGITFPLGPGYQLRFEARDLIVPLPRPAGPAMDTAQIVNLGALPDPPLGTRIMHIPTIMVGLDVVLERRRGHRY